MPTRPPSAPAPTKRATAVTFNPYVGLLESSISLYPTSTDSRQTRSLPQRTRWVYDETKGVPYLSANTPIEESATPDQQCGRVVHTGIHVATVANDTIAPFPKGCVSSNLTPQEKAMEFLLFELSSCVSNDMLPPAPPTPMAQ